MACVALYACGVRRFKGLWRVCSCFSSFAFLLLPFVLSLCSCFLSCLYSLCPALLWLFFVVVFLDLCLCFLFPLRTIRKERARRVGASSLRLLWDCLVVQILVTLSKNSVAVALARSNSFG